MKKISIPTKILCCIFSVCSLSLNARIGCLEKSYHLKESSDPKTIHYVKNCTCHCKTQSLDRGFCPDCRHYHEPIRWEFIKVSKK